MSNIDKILETVEEKRKMATIDSAIEILNQALILFPNEIRLLERRSFYLYETDRFQEALIDINKIIELSNNHELIAWAHSRRYVINLHASNAIQALEDIDWLIESAPDYVIESDYVMKGELLERLGDFEEAIAALSLFPADELHTEKERLFYRGRTFIRLSQYEKAIADFTWILENIPENQWYGVVLTALNLRALAYLKLGYRDLYDKDIELWEKYYPTLQPVLSFDDYFAHYPVQKN